MRASILMAAALLTAPAWAQPVSLAGFSDAGSFIGYINEERITRSTFVWKPDGTFQTETVISIAGQSWTGLVSLTPDSQGRWIKASYDHNVGKTVVEREGNNVTITSPHVSGKGTMPPDVLVFQDDSPALISQALLRYDRQKGGRQTFGVLMLRGEKTEGGDLTLERQDTVERTVAGRTLKLTRWTYTLPFCEVHVLADPDNRVYLVSGIPWIAPFGVTGKDIWGVREGYESLIERPVDPSVSQAKYDVKLEAGVKMPMRDGVKLSTDLYLPVGVPKAPVILVRTPYKKEMIEIQGRYYARRGYVFAIQDVRGRFASEGEWEPLLHEPKDGYDAIEWLARQPWSTGKVGMIGASYLGWVQWLAATQHPPHLAAMIPNVSPPDPLHNLPFEYGILVLLPAIRWANLVETNSTGELSGATRIAVFDKNFDELLKPLPVIDLDKTVLGKESAYWRRWLAHPGADPYWGDTLFLDKLKKFRVPVFHQSGWFDGDAIGTKLNYLKMAAYGHTSQKLTIGPWEHSDTAEQVSLEVNYSPSAVIDLQRDYLRWFDHWLKGMDNGIMQEPLVNIFTMGSNRWLHGSKYPLPETRFEKLYLSDGGQLRFTPPDGKQTEDRYVYDPANPTPKPDFTKPPRKDMLVYTTPAFEKPYTIAGPLSAVLYAATSARDTDWFVYLQDVDGDGKSSDLWTDSCGKLRARYRNSMAKPELLQPGRIYRYDIDLWHTGVTIAPGHRLRVVIASADFPTYARNLNTGGNSESETRFVTASQTIYHDAKHPSHILLPMIPEKP